MGTILNFEAARRERDSLYQARLAITQAAVRAKEAPESGEPIDVLRRLRRKLNAAIAAAGAVC